MKDETALFSSFILLNSSFACMRVTDFLDLVAHETRKQLPARYRKFHTWKRYTLIQLFYARRSIHYEVWVRGGEIHALEIGLHCEADAATNARLLQLFDTHLLEIKDALGSQIEAEQWTKSWTRVHELLPYKTLDESTARQCAKRLAQMIPLFEPLLIADRSREIRALQQPTAKARAQTRKPRAKAKMG
jgi:hypothetical protein